MRGKIGYLILSSLTLVALLVSCTAAPEEESEGKTVIGKVVEKEQAKVEEEKEPISGEVVTKEAGLQYGGIMTISTSLDPSHLDPYYDSSMASNPIQKFYLEDLGIVDWAADRTEYDFSGYTPMKYRKGNLIESWETPDTLTIILNVRKGIKWQNKQPVNGRELTAYDVEYTFHRMLGLGSGFTTPSPYVDSNLKVIQSAEATDKYTVVLKLSEESPLLIQFLIPGGPNMMVVPKEAVELYGNLEDWRNAVGTGPFILSDYARGSSLSFVNNPDYWRTDELHPENRIPYVDRVEVLIVPDQTTSLAALRTGKLDITGGLELEQAQSLWDTEPELNWRRYRSQAFCFYFRNDLPLFTDIRVRRALQMAINLQAIADSYYSGEADPLPSFVNKNNLDVWSPLEEYPAEVQEAFTYNPEKAKQLLAEAGYPDGFKTSVLVTPQRYGTVELAELTKGYFEAINVELEIKSMEYTANTAARYAGNFELAFFVTGSGGSPWGAFTYAEPGKAWNIGRVNDPVWKGMIDAIKSNPDPEERIRLSRETNIYGTSQHWYVGFPIPYTYSFWQPWLKGYQGEGGLSTYGAAAVYARIWVDQDLKQKSTGRR